MVILYHPSCTVWAYRRQQEFVTYGRCRNIDQGRRHISEKDIIARLAQAHQNDLRSSFCSSIGTTKAYAPDSHVKYTE